MFTKTLNDVIKATTKNNSKALDTYISQCITDCKAEITQDINFKANAVQKLLYFHLLGYDVSWCSFHITELTVTSKYKRLGYLAASLILNEDLLPLTINVLRKDLKGNNATISLACMFICSRNVTGLFDEILTLLSHVNVRVKQKAIYMVTSIAFRDQEKREILLFKFRELLQDKELQNSIVCNLHELYKIKRESVLPFVPALYNILTDESCSNWMILKILKIFQVLVFVESRLLKKIKETVYAVSEKSMSVLFECIRLLALDDDSCGWSFEKLKVFFKSSDINLQFLALSLLCDHPKLVMDKSLIFDCLNDSNSSDVIRMKAIKALCCILDKGNSKEITEFILGLPFVDNEVVKVLMDRLCEENFQVVSDLEWLFGIIVSVITNFDIDLSKILVDFSLKEDEGLRNSLCQHIIKEFHNIKTSWNGVYFVLSEFFEDKDCLKGIINFSDIPEDRLLPFIWFLIKVYIKFNLKELNNDILDFIKNIDAKDPELMDLLWVLKVMVEDSFQIEFERYQSLSLQTDNTTVVDLDTPFCDSWDVEETEPEAIVQSNVSTEKVNRENNPFYIKS